MRPIDKLENMKDEEIQSWLRRINPDDLKSAIAGINKNIQECILRNLSNRAQNVIKETINQKLEDDNIIERQESLRRLEAEIPIK